MERSESQLSPEIESTIAELFGTVSGESIATFENLTGDADLDGLAISIRESFLDMQLRLGPGLQVLDSEAIGNTDPCRAAIDRKWIYTGSVRRLQDTIAVSAQLTQCPDGAVTWSNSWRYRHDDLVSISDEVASRMTAESQTVSIHRSGERGTVRFHLRQRKRESTLEVLRRIEEIQEEVLARYPEKTGHFFGSLFEIHAQILIEGWGDPPSVHVIAIDTLAETGLASAPDDFFVQIVAGFAALFKGERDAMLRAFRRAAEIGDTVAVTHAHLGRALATVGHTDEALRSLDTAMSMSPEDPALVGWLAVEAAAFFAAERYEEARESAREAIDLNANDLFNRRADAFVQLAVSSAYLGRGEEARRALEDARELRPALDEAVLLLPLTVSDPELRERYVRGLRMAGIKE